MPQVSRPSSITILNGENGSGKLVITLELNINLNTNGIQAAISDVIEPQSVPTPPKKSWKDDDPIDFVIPDFGSSEIINFGKKA